MKAASIVAFGRAKFGRFVQILEKGLKLLFQRTVAHPAGAGYRLHEFKARPLGAHPLRQSLCGKCACAAYDGDVRAVNALFLVDSSIEQHPVQRIDELLQFGRYRSGSQAGNPRPRPVLEAIKVQPKRLDPNLRSTLEKKWNTVRRERADEGQRYVPVSTIDGVPLDRLYYRVDDIAQLLALPMIRPQREK